MSDGRWLRRVSAELQSPVRVDAGFDRRVVDAIRGSKRRRQRITGGFALGALALIMALAWRVLRPAAATEVEFAIEVPAATAVTVVGDFNDWDRARTPLVRSADGGRWSARVPLAGGVYQYAFLVDGELVPDPQQPFALQGDYGQSVSMVTVQ